MEFADSACPLLYHFNSCRINRKRKHLHVRRMLLLISALPALPPHCLTLQNDRVKWWSIIQAGLLIVICAWNVHYLKSWFEVRRVL